MPTTTSSGAKIPAGADNNNIPSAFSEYDASKDPRLTTAQIAAMLWSAKPAGWTAYDTTLGRQVISTGAAMVPILDGRDEIGVWKPWSPQVSSTNVAPTFTFSADACRMTVIGRTLLARATVTVTGAGSGSLLLLFPVSARPAGATQHVGSLMVEPSMATIPLMFAAGGGAASAAASAGQAPGTVLYFDLRYEI